jgi:hypothetical protein
MAITGLQYTVERHLQISTAGETDFAVGRLHAKHGVVVQMDVQIAPGGDQRTGLQLNEIHVRCLRLEAGVKPLATGFEGFHGHFK